jgi:hypothetical protein
VAPEVEGQVEARGSVVVGQQAGAQAALLRRSGGRRRRRVEGEEDLENRVPRLMMLALFIVEILFIQRSETVDKVDGKTK